MSKRDIDVPAVGEVGYIFHKHFPGHGWFEGKVIVIRPGAKGGKDRRCQYEDGDVEDCTLAHLKGLPKRKKRSQKEAATKQKSSSSSSSSSSGKTAKKNKKNLPEATNTSTAADVVVVSSDADTRAAKKASTNNRSKMHRPSNNSPILPRPSARGADVLKKVTAESLAVEAAAEAVGELVVDESPNVDSVILGRQKGMDAPGIVTASTYTGNEAGVDLHGEALLHHLGTSADPLIQQASLVGRASGNPQLTAAAADLAEAEAELVRLRSLRVLRAGSALPPQYAHMAHPAPGAVPGSMPHLAGAGASPTGTGMAPLPAAAPASAAMAATADAALAAASAGKKEKKVKFCKAPGAPKRFKSAFIFFTMHRHKTIRKEIDEKLGKGDRVCSTPVPRYTPLHHL